MIGLASTDVGRVRVTGALDVSVLPLLTRAAAGGFLVLDVSGVADADQAVITQLARFSPEQYELVGCPSWLALAVERRRRELRTEGW